MVMASKVLYVYGMNTGLWTDDDILHLFVVVLCFFMDTLHHLTVILCLFLHVFVAVVLFWFTVVLFRGYLTLD